MGRAVFVLCLLTGIATACPSRFTSANEQQAFFAAIEHAVPSDRNVQLASQPYSDEWQGASIGFTLMGLCALAFVITRANAVRRTFATSHKFVDVEHDLLRLVARAQRNRTAVFVIACLAVAAAIVALPVEVGVRTVLLVTPTLLLISAMFSMFRLQMLVDLERCQSVRVASHGDFLFASQGTQLIGWVASPPSLIARASALPTAKLRG